MDGRLSSIKFNIFNVHDFFYKVENTLGSGTIPSSDIATVNALIYATYVIIVGFIISVILSLMKKEKGIISIISSIGAVIINIGFILFSIVTSDEISMQGLSDFGGFSVTVFPYLIIVLSCLIVFKSIKGRKNFNNDEKTSIDLRTTIVFLKKLIMMFGITAIINIALRYLTIEWALISLMDSLIYLSIFCIFISLKCRYVIKIPIAIVIWFLYTILFGKIFVFSVMLGMPIITILTFIILDKTLFKTKFFSTSKNE